MSERSCWQPIHLAPEGKFLLVRGDSGWRGVLYRVKVAKLHSLRLTDGEVIKRWLDHAGDPFADDGGPPTGWRLLPEEEGE